MATARRVAQDKKAVTTYVNQPDRVVLEMSVEEANVVLTALAGYGGYADNLSFVLREGISAKAERDTSSPEQATEAKTATGGDRLADYYHGWKDGYQWRRNGR